MPPHLRRLSGEIAGDLGCTRIRFATPKIAAF